MARERGNLKSPFFPYSIIHSAYMSKQKRIAIIVILTAVVSSFSAYVWKVVLPREDFRAIDVLTVLLTILAILKNIQLIIREVKHNARK